MSYLIDRHGELVAETDLNLKSGAIVEASFDTCAEKINANRDVNLANAFRLKVSNAKKWEGYQCGVSATPINGSDDEFLLVDWLR